MPAGSRRRSRIVAFQVLYEADQSGHDPQAVLERRLAAAPADAEGGEDEGGPRPLAEEAADFARSLVEGVAAHREQLDARIAAQAPAFPLDSMAPIDRNVLRLALFEICFDNRRAPLPVVINEAVELAKGYGSESSGRFVHGVLGGVAAAEATNHEATANEHAGRSAGSD